MRYFTDFVRTNDRWKLLISAFLALAFTCTLAHDAYPKTRSSLFRELDGLYEPSGIVQLLDGRLLAIEDEATRPFTVLTPQHGATPFLLDTLRPRSLLEPVTVGLSDLEGISIGLDGFVYSITSHSRKSNGKRDPKRERLLRFRVTGNRLVESGVRNDFRKALNRAFPKLHDAAKKNEFKNRGGLNIEGLAFDAKGERLWIGLRAPLIDHKAILVAVLNPGDAFEHDEKFRFDDLPQQLDLDGGGIRDIVYDPYLGGYLIVSQREGTKKEKPFKLWLWNGEPAASPKRVRIAGVKDLKRTEGIARVNLNGKDGLILLSDDGNRRKRKMASYLLVDYAQLTIESD